MKMQNSKVLKVILVLSGILLILPGLFSLIGPVAFTARNGADITTSISLLNDYRSLGGILFGSGIIILLGAIHQRMAFTSTVVAAVLYTTFTGGRVLSMVLDGMPSDTLFKATIVEGIFSVLAIFALVMYRDLPASSSVRQLEQA